MATTIINEEGQEMEVFTQEEIQAQLAEREAALKAEYEKMLAEKDAHVKEKLDQFQQAKKSVDIEAEEAKRLAEDAKRIAEEAKLSVTQAQETALNAKKEVMITSVVGNDVELRKKIEASYGLLNMPAGNEIEINARLQAAMTLAGI